MPPSSATRIRIALKLKDDIYLNDTVATSANSSLGVTFNDATTFHLSANSKLTIDNYVYEDGGKQNAGIFDIGKGTVAFVAAAVAKTGDMKITTPTASLGIRGTTGVVEVPEGATAGSANNVNIKLYPDADGRVGRIEVNDRMGTRLGALTQGASGFAIRPGAGGRFAAAPLTISPREAARDQGFVRQVHATQSVGRQIVTEQRAFRRANPGLNNRGNQPGPQRPSAATKSTAGQNRPGQPQPGAPNRQENRQGQQPRPGGPPQPGQPPRPGPNPRQGGQGVTPPRPSKNPNIRQGGNRQRRRSPPFSRGKAAAAPPTRHPAARPGEQASAAAAAAAGAERKTGEEEALELRAALMCDRPCSVSACSPADQATRCNQFRTICARLRGRSSVEAAGSLSQASSPDGRRRGIRLGGLDRDIDIGWIG